MPKTKVQKAKLVEQYKDLLKDAKMVVVLNYDGVTVNQIEEMRDKFAEHSQQFAIVKNNLLRIALKQAGVELSDEVYGQPLAIAVNKEDEVLVCKDIAGFAGSIEKMQIVGGIYDGNVVGVDKIEQLSKLPGREELLGKVVGTIHAPITGFVNVMRGSLSGLMNVLHQIEQQKS